jgi:hypothetical protein
MIVGVLLGLLAVTIGYGAVRLILDRLTDQQAAALMAVGLFGSLIMLPVTGDFPLGWEILGGLLGAGVGTLIESRQIDYRPATATLTGHLVRIGIGGAGIMFFLLLGSLVRDLGGPAMIRVGLFFLAGLWAMLATPYILSRMGHSEPIAEPEFEDRRVVQA